MKTTPVPRTNVVLHPDLPPGSLRFVLSLRATGEGRISSITFRTGLLDAKGVVTINPPTRFCLEPARVPNVAYEQGVFERKLRELGLVCDFIRQTLEALGEWSTLEELQASSSRVAEPFGARDQQSEAVARNTVMLAQSNCEVQFPSGSRLSERVLFPTTPSQSNAIEDARFVLFRNDDGTRTYYATFATLSLDNMLAAME